MTNLDRYTEDGYRITTRGDSPTTPDVVCLDDDLRKRILAALNRPAFMWQEWRSTNDVNGNPRRVTMVFSPDGEIVAALDQGYSGDRIPDNRKTPRVVLPSVNVGPAEYRDAVRGETLRCAARKYLAADGPTGMTVIGYARKLGVKDYAAFKSAVWACERFANAPWAAEYKAVIA